jgi:hypothetical protein
MTITTNNQHPTTPATEKEFFFILTLPKHEERILQFCTQAHLCMIGRAVITDPELSKKLRKNGKQVKRISSIEELPPPDVSLPELDVVLSLAVDYTQEPCECQLGHILSNPMVRIQITELAESHKIRQFWYQFNPIERIRLSELPEGHQIDPFNEKEPEQPMLDFVVTVEEGCRRRYAVKVPDREDTFSYEEALRLFEAGYGKILTSVPFRHSKVDQIEPKEEDEDAWKRSVIAHDVSVLQQQGYEVVGPDAPVAPPQPVRKPRPEIKQAVPISIGMIKRIYRQTVEHLRLLEMLHEGQYEYPGAEDEHTFDGQPHEGCFICLNHFTTAHFLLDMLDKMGTMALKLFNVPGRENNLIQAIELYAWATHRIDRNPSFNRDNYVREGQEEVLDYAAGAVDDIYRRSREMWILTPEQEAHELSIELMDKLVMAFARTYLEETHKYYEWRKAFLNNKGKTPFYQF